MPSVVTGAPGVAPTRSALAPKEAQGRYGDPMVRRATGVVAVLALFLGTVLTACGAEEPVTPVAVPQTLQECRDQWREVGESVIGLDEDPNPSALASRWTSVTATIVLYENTESAENCQANIEAQVTAITLLREFMVTVQPYDMEFQLAQVAAGVDLYLNDALPEPYRDSAGKSVTPPTKNGVRAAAAALSEYAAAANAELQPAWAQLATVELTDADAVETAVGDLDSLARNSPNWLACQSSLRLIEAAITAQEGGSTGRNASPSP